MITRKEMTRMLLKEGLLSCLANNSLGYRTKRVGTLIPIIER